MKASLGGEAFLFGRQVVAPNPKRLEIPIRSEGSRLRLPSRNTPDRSARFLGVRWIASGRRKQRPSDRRAHPKITVIVRRAFGLCDSHLPPQIRHDCLDQTVNVVTSGFDIHFEAGLSHGF